MEEGETKEEAKEKICTMIQNIEDERVLKRLEVAIEFEISREKAISS
jgi:hypothetical protein